MRRRGTPLDELEQRPEDAVRLELVGEGFEAPTIYLEGELPADWPAALRGPAPDAAWTCWAEGVYGRPECRVLPEAIGGLGLTLETEPAATEAAVAPDVKHTRDLPDAFFVLLKGVAQRVGLDAEKLLAVMHVESGGIRASAMHPSGAAVGLIQFSTMGAWSTLRGVGWGGTVDAFGRSGPSDSSLVERYFSGKPHPGIARTRLRRQLAPGERPQATQRGAGVTALRGGGRGRHALGRPGRSLPPRQRRPDVTRRKTTLDDLRVYLRRNTGARWAGPRAPAQPLATGLIRRLRWSFVGLAALLAQEIPRL